MNARFPSMSPPPTHSASWEEGYEVGYREGGDSATEDWKLVVEDLEHRLEEAQLQVIEATNPGIDMAAVRAFRALARVPDVPMSPDPETAV